MPPEQELKMQASRDNAYLSEADKVWKGDAKDFNKGYDAIQPLYNGT